MTNQVFPACCLSLILASGACNAPRDGFVTDPDAWAQIAGDCQLKRAAMPGGHLFALLDSPLPKAEHEALTFLYAYMPLGDAADYTGEFYLDNVRAAFRAREEMPWGKDIPEEIFRHFVLPVRVNNEALDESRRVFYEELRGRVADMSLRKAALEVNHWCHEKVVYAPSDARTASPLASVRAARGRCGEESVLTVAALRSVGIPARQVYTPRWAHTDDNHAWVEVWVDGQWYFMGACEPEPELNMAWFNAPARRSALMHAKVFGRYGGPEEALEHTRCYTEINVTANYAPVARPTVRVIDAQGRPAAGATVEFKLYNYAEFYTVARQTADRKGEASLAAGKGDMLVWASRDGWFGWGKLSFGKDRSLVVALDKRPGEAIDLALDIVPPAEAAVVDESTEAQRQANARRLMEEDALRSQYTATFRTDADARSLARAWGLDGERVARLLTASRGNYPEIEAFLREASPDRRADALALLEAVSEKDLRDAPAAVLADHLEHTPADRRGDGFVACVLNPRIADEQLSAYKAFFRAVLPPSLQREARNDPAALAAWMRQSVAIADDLNPQRIPMTPPGVWKARVADACSRDICFVAMARSLGIEARIEPVAGRVQYVSGGQWMDAALDAPEAPAALKGAVTATYAPIPSLGDPKYYSHFTIARIRDDGTLHTLHFGADGQGDMGTGDTWSRILRQPLSLDEGHYLLTTGTRMAKGNVLAQVTAFTVAAGSTVETKLAMRENRTEAQVIGSIDAEASYRLAEDGGLSTLLQTAGRGYFVVALLGAGQEPTNHALRDIASLAAGFEQWGRRMILLFPSQEDWQAFDAKEFGRLPSTVVFGIDADGRMARMLAGLMRPDEARALPVVVIADTFGRVVFFSQGYTIGLGEQMLQTIGKL
jgi:transglutaminase-like putative cysteine protease